MTNFQKLNSILLVVVLGVCIGLIPIKKRNHLTGEDSRRAAEPEVASLNWALTNLFTRTNLDNMGGGTFYFKTNSANQKIFLSVTNRFWLQASGVCIVNLTDLEWAAVADRYPDKLTTNRIDFYEREK